ncbi:MAG: YXWGXW repeat-containing protein [Acidobacteriaceae bacterium]
MLLAASLGAAAQSSTATVIDSGVDPAEANVAPVPRTAQSNQTARVAAQRPMNEAQQQAQDYPQQQAAPIERRAPRAAYQGAAQQSAPPGYDQSSSQGADEQNGSAAYDDREADEYAADLTEEATMQAPPPLPDYDQPPCPDPDYLWTPGYWAWVPTGYYWVPGVWVAAPYYGALWTPGYWAFVGDEYRFHHGFWGPHIGFYGGINYGYGYTGYGYYGGYWRDRHFFYNTAVNRVNVNIVRNVYVRNVVVNNVIVNNRYDNRVSYNGGRGGVMVRPRPEEIAVLHEQRIPPMQSQLAIRRQAEGNRGQFYQENHGRPQNAVFTRPIAADRTLPAALPRTAGSFPNGGGRGVDPRPGQQQVGPPLDPVQPAIPTQPDLSHGGIYRAGQSGGQRPQPNGQLKPAPQEPSNPDNQSYPRGGQPGAVPNGQPMQSRPPYRDRPAQGISPSSTPASPNPEPAYQARPIQPSPQPNALPQPAQAQRYHRGPMQPSSQPAVRPDAPDYPQGRPEYERRGGQTGGSWQSRYEDRGSASRPAAAQPAPRLESAPRPQPQVQQSQPQYQPRPQPQSQPQPQYRPAPPQGSRAEPQRPQQR